MGAAADCEAIGPGFLAQPINSLTTLAFVAAGLLVLRRPDRIWVGTALIAAGVGSFLFHGPIPPGAEWAHDVTLAWLIVTVPTAGTRWERLGSLPALVVLAALFALAPMLADPVAVVLAVLAIAVLLTRHPTPMTWGALSLLTIAALIGRLGATGGPWCDPESFLQAHGFWHIASATSVALWAWGETRREAERADAAPGYGPGGETSWIPRPGGDDGLRHPDDAG